MGTDWRDNDREIEPVVEIFQGLRTSYEAVGAPQTSEPDGESAQQFGYEPAGMMSNAWAKGYRLGVISGSENVGAGSMMRRDLWPRQKRNGSK